MFKYLIKIQS